MKIRVLLADDHAIVRDGLRYLLEAQGDIEVVCTVGNGREAIKETERLKPDVVVMDIAMPEMNGIEATHQICHQVQGVRVIILSMYSTREHIYRAFRAGASSYVLKETAGQELVNAIRVVASGGRYLSPKITDEVVESFVQVFQPEVSENLLERLSAREREVLQLVVEGKSSAEIAQVLFLSPKTVETYRSRIMEKLSIQDLPSLVKFAIQHGITSLD